MELMGKKPPANAVDMRHGYDPWVGKIPLEVGMATHSSIFANPNGQRSLEGYSPWGHKELAQLSD